MNYDVIVIGAGPAGCAAATFTAESDYKTLMIHKGTGSFVADLNWMLPGFPKHIHAGEWMKNLQEDSKRRGVTWVEEEVSQVALGETCKEIITKGAKRWETPVVILASGCYDRKGLIKGEGKLSGRGVSYSAIQDGFQFKNESVAVEGKDEKAAEEALYLIRFVDKLYFVIPAARLDVPEKLFQEIKRNRKIQCLFSASIKEISGESSVEEVSILASGQEKKFSIKGVFLFSRIGIPTVDYLKGTVDVSKEGGVLVDEHFMTSISGVFACGDLIAGTPQLTFVSAAQGLACGLQTVEYLRNKNRH